MLEQRGTAAGTLMIVSGISTVLASAAWFLGLVWFCVGVLWIVPLMIGVGEIIVGAAILGGQPTPRVRSVSVLGIIAAMLCGNLIGVGLEVAALVVSAKPKALLDG